MRTTRRAAIAGGVLTGVLVMAACSAGSDGDSADSASGGSASESRRPGGRDGRRGRAGGRPRHCACAGASAGSDLHRGPAGRGEEPGDGDGAGDGDPRGAGGYLFSQQATLGDDASIEAVYKIPPAAFDATIDTFAEIGEVKTRDVDTEDVTGAVVDLEARLASAADERRPIARAPDDEWRRQRSARSRADTRAARS